MKKDSKIIICNFDYPITKHHRDLDHPYPPYLVPVAQRAQKVVEVLNGCLEVSLLKLGRKVAAVNQYVPVLENNVSVVTSRRRAHETGARKRRKSARERRRD